MKQVHVVEICWSLTPTTRDDFADEPNRSILDAAEPTTDSVQRSSPDDPLAGSHVGVQRASATAFV